MRKAARDHASEDARRKEAVDKLNQADSLIFSSEKNLAEYGDKLPDEKRASIQAGLERLKEVQKSQNVDEVDSAIEQLNAAWSAASEDLYRAQQAEAPGAEGAPPPEASGDGEPAGEPVQDADFEVVDEGGTS